MPVFPDKGGSLRELLSLIAGAPADQAQAFVAALSERLGGLKVFPVFASGRSEWDDHVAAGRAFYCAAYNTVGVAAKANCVQLWNPTADTDLLVFDAAAELDTIANARMQAKMCGTRLGSARAGVVTNARGDNPASSNNKGQVWFNDGTNLAGAMQVCRTWYAAAMFLDAGAAPDLLTPEMVPGAVRPRLIARLSPNTGYAMEDCQTATSFPMIANLAWAEVPRGTT